MNSENILFIRCGITSSKNTSHPRHIYPPLDIFYIISTLRERNFTSTFKDFYKDGYRYEDLSYNNEKIVVIHAKSFCEKEAIEIAQFYQSHSAKVILIGQLALHHKNRTIKEINESIDFVIYGEPETACVEIVTNLLSNKELRNNEDINYIDVKYIKTPKKTNDLFLDYPVPFPIGPAPTKNWAYVLTAWGCPYKCSFCTDIVRKSSGSKHRIRDVKQIVDEIELYINAGYEGIYFDDDTLLVNRPHFKSLFNEIINRGLNFEWVIHARPDEISDMTCDLLSKVGNGVIKLGIESADDKVIKSLGKYQGNKSWKDICENALRLTNKYNIGTIALLMVGCPEESELSIKNTEDLIKSGNATYIQVQCLTIYPDTELYTKYGPDKYTSYHYKTDDNEINPTISARQKYLYRKFYMRPKYVISHFIKYWRHYLNPNTYKSHLLHTLKGAFNEII